MVFDAVLLVLMAVVIFAFVLTPLLISEAKVESDAEPQADATREPVAAENQTVRDTS